MAKSENFCAFVHDNYGNLLSELILLVNEVAFSRVDIRLARYMLKVADTSNVVHSAHQKLALDMGSVCEVISRYINEWEKQGWIDTQRGKILLLDRDKLIQYSLDASNVT